jgi:hypothetical protein
MMSSREVTSNCQTPNACSHLTSLQRRPHSSGKASLGRLSGNALVARPYAAEVGADHFLRVGPACGPICRVASRAARGRVNGEPRPSLCRLATVEHGLARVS